MLASYRKPGNGLWENYEKWTKTVYRNFEKVAKISRKYLLNVINYNRHHWNVEKNMIHFSTASLHTYIRKTFFTFSAYNRKISTAIAIS